MDRLLRGCNNPSPPREGLYIASYPAGFLDRLRQAELFQGWDGARLNEVRTKLLVASGITIALDQRDTGAGPAEGYRRRATGDTRSDDCDIVLGL
jgi:hypothetical protein